MLCIRFLFVLILTCAAMITTVHPQSSSPNVPPDWLTHTERTDYRETPRYDETIEFSRRLAASSNLIRFTDFGRSPEGRLLPLLIAAKDKAFDRQSARKQKKTIVLVQACIHAGESEGKDAGLALLRDIAITKTREALLDHVVVLFIPIYNTDGHERFSPYNRINQNGPDAMGWRANATNLNLNRDYMKADAPETRAWLRLWNEWNPDLFIDCHTTDGSDFRYNVTYQFEGHENVAAPVGRWMRDSFERRIVPAVETEGNLLAPYLVLRDGTDPAKGLEGFIATPRFSTGYTALRNRPGLLIETHMLKNYRSRVRGTYDVVRYTLEEINRASEELLRAARESDEESIALGRQTDPARRVALSVELTDKSVPFQFKGVAYKRELSDVSGQMRVTYGTTPLDISVPFFNQARAKVTIAPPRYYIIPPQWAEVIDRIRAHGLQVEQLAQDLTIEVESYRFSEVKFAQSSFEGRVMRTYKVAAVRERRIFPAGSIIVPTAQAGARVLMSLLEPEAPDSLAAWGFFNPVFEQKEYGEDYVLERIAREMMERDGNLRREFEERVANDPKFAGSARERLRFFFNRSPYHDQNLNLYPVGRVTTEIESQHFAKHT
ncbi:MAG: M14 family metallopeptidase [Pyrinomonadaceae bacterium]|nr:M14 family metallopeptidase [Pyrinomonadaceae bacterium]